MLPICVQNTIGKIFILKIYASHEKLVGLYRAHLLVFYYSCGAHWYTSPHRNFSTLCHRKFLQDMRYAEFTLTWFGPLVHQDVTSTVQVVRSTLIFLRTKSLPLWNFVLGGLRTFMLLDTKVCLYSVVIVPKAFPPDSFFLPYGKTECCVA